MPVTILLRILRSRTRRAVAATALVLAAPLALATPVTLAITGTTAAGAPMSGIVTYDDSLDGPCRYLSCFSSGPTYVDLLVDGTRYAYGDLAYPGRTQIAEDRQFVDVEAYGPAGPVADLTLWRASGLWGVAPGEERWRLDAGGVQFAGPLRSSAPAPRVLPPARVPEPPAAALLSGALVAVVVASRRRAFASCRRTTTLRPIGTRRSEA